MDATRKQERDEFTFALCKLLFEKMERKRDKKRKAESWEDTNLIFTSTPRKKGVLIIVLKVDMVSGHVAKGKMKMLTIEARKAEKIEKILKDVKSFIGCKRDIDILQCVYIDEKGISVNNCETAITRLWDASVIVKGKGHALIPFEFLLYLLGGFKTFKGTKLHGLKGQRVKITITPIVYKPNEYQRGM